MQTLRQYPLSTGGCFDVVLAHLRQQREQIDKLIGYLEELRKYQIANTHIATNPLANAAPAAPTCIVGRIGDEPQPPPLLKE